jgi:hypothetical protein
MYTFITKHIMHQLYFVPRVLINRDGTKRVIQASTEVKLQLIHAALLELFTPHLDETEEEYLLEAVTAINEFLTYISEPGDSFGEPPITLDEIHTAAWQQHKEMHS